MSTASPGETTADAADPVPPRPPDEEPGAAGVSDSARLVVFVAAGLVAAATAALAIDLVHGQRGVFQFPKEVAEKLPPVGMGQALPPEARVLYEKTLRSISYKNTSLSLAIAGSILGGFFGLAAGAVRRSLAAGLAGLFAGTVLGGLFGAAAGVAEVSAAAALKDMAALDPIVQTIGIHLAGWLVLGAGLGLIVGWTQGTSGRFIVPTLAGALLAALLYPPLAAVLFAGERSNQPIPTGYGNKVFWLALGAVLMAVAMYGGRARNRAATTPTAPVSA